MAIEQRHLTTDDGFALGEEAENTTATSNIEDVSGNNSNDNNNNSNTKNQTNVPLVPVPTNTWKCSVCAVTALIVIETSHREIHVSSCFGKIFVVGFEK